MGINIKSITENYRERIQRLALFDPLFRLQNKKSKDNSDKIIDYHSLGLLALLFFFENMLMRNRKTGVKELAEFFHEINQGEMDLGLEDFEKVARTIIETFRPPSGKRSYRSFYNWETRREEIVQYSILKADKSDIKGNTQYYTLDEQGLELVFATKEYFSEFQLSINQLVLRKQLEKGEFVNALRQIDEMTIDVTNLKDRIINIKHEIQRNIVSDETYKRYKRIIDDVNLRLVRESGEFEELRAFVRETRERLGHELNEEKDRKTYELIVKIDRELGEVHNEHKKLLQESIILKTSALQAAQESLYYVGIDSFNFNQEITSRLISSPLPLEASRRLIEPFLFIERFETWSPLTVFSAQRIEEESKEDKAKEFPELYDEELGDLDKIIQRKNFRRIMEMTLEIMGDEREITLREIVKYMKEDKEYTKLLGHRSFYDFWIILHQRSPLIVEVFDDEEGVPLFREATNLLKGKIERLVATEIKGIINEDNRYSIGNIKLKLEEKKNDVS
ncbi:replicative DNA helicase [Wukongibacter sp. M2B1]|uniref:replicative DNA helicase n=1 Tax=Wukongibacter sp. M2B1 TaxID=3088895 RepID=UPI003D7A8D22